MHRSVTKLATLRLVTRQEKGFKASIDWAVCPVRRHGVHAVDPVAQVAQVFRRGWLFIDGMGQHLQALHGLVVRLTLLWGGWRLDDEGSDTGDAVLNGCGHCKCVLLHNETYTYVNTHVSVQRACSVQCVMCSVVRHTACHTHDVTHLVHLIQAFHITAFQKPGQTLLDCFLLGLSGSNCLQQRRRSKIQVISYSLDSFKRSRSTLLAVRLVSRCCAVRA